MEKERKIKTLSLVALIVAVLGLTVAFAALSQQLTISGTARVNTAEWSIHFANLGEAQITGTAKENATPNLSDTSITGLDVSVMKPGDKIVYTFDIVNDGTINAKISSFTNFALKEGSEALSDKITYGIYYDDDTPINQNDTLNQGDTKHAKIVVEYNEEATEVFDTQMTIFENANATINYVQAD